MAFGVYGVEGFFLIFRVYLVQAWLGVGLGCRVRGVSVVFGVLCLVCLGGVANIALTH